MLKTIVAIERDGFDIRTLARRTMNNVHVDFYL